MTDTGSGSEGPYLTETKELDEIEGLMSHPLFAYTRMSGHE
jgi:hypothetical protein